MTVPLSRAGAGIVIVYLGTEDVWLFLRTMLGSGDKSRVWRQQYPISGTLALKLAL